MRRKEGLVDGWVDGWMDGWIDKFIYRSVQNALLEINTNILHNIPKES